MNIKQVGSLFTICLISSFFACNLPVSKDVSGNDANSQKVAKTNFNSYEELHAYTQNESYSTLKSLWGEGSIGQPWDASGVGELNVMLKVTWNNIIYKGKPLVVIYKSPIDFSKTPEAFYAIDNY